MDKHFLKMLLLESIENYIQLHDDNENRIAVLAIQMENLKQANIDYQEKILELRGQYEELEKLEKLEEMVNA